MSGGMVGVLNAHAIAGFSAGTHTACRCDGTWVPNAEYRAHVAVELVKAGYGNVREAEVAGLLQAADEMPIETLLGADKASAWLRQRAHSLDPEGRALVQVIHDRKAEG